MKKYFALILAITFLFSCGGGGGSSSPVASESPGSLSSGGAAQGYQVQEKIQAVD